jgi:Mg2+ and Co2+ transporter CorA
MFVGFGINSASDDRLQEYRLPGPGEMRFVPEASPDEVATYKKDFARWILSNGLRELTEAFALCLDEMHKELLRLHQVVGHRTQTGPKKFQDLGLYAKLCTLEQEFGISTDAKEQLESFTWARNCLSHRGGIVADRDCNDGEMFVLKFHRLRVFVKQPSGEETEAREAIEQKLVLRDGGQVMAQLVESKKSFVVGSMIALEADEIQDVLWTIYRSADGLRQAFESLARAKVGRPSPI